MVLDIDFGDGAVISTLGNNVNKNYWNNLTIFHKGQEVLVSLNDEVKLLDAPGTLHHLYIDPEIYIGGGPELAKKNGAFNKNDFHFHDSSFSKVHLSSMTLFKINILII